MYTHCIDRKFRLRSLAYEVMHMFVALYCRAVGEMMEATALFIVVMSMLSIGGTVGPLLRRLKLCRPTGNSETDHIASDVPFQDTTSGAGSQGGVVVNVDASSIPLPGS